MKLLRDFTEWSTLANQLGWVHIHDNLIVVDDPGTGECLGEFDSDAEEGWINEI